MRCYTLTTLQEKWRSARPAWSHLYSQALRTGTGEESLPPGPAPVISTALFLKVLMTVPSFRRRRGLLLRSATFCFSLERTFKLGSEAGEKVARAQTHPHKWAHTEAQPLHIPTSTSQEPYSGRLGWAVTHLFFGGGSHRGYHRAQAKAICRREASQGGHSGEGNSGPKKHGGLPYGLRGGNRDISVIAQRAGPATLQSTFMKYLLYIGIENGS